MEDGKLRLEGEHFKESDNNPLHYCNLVVNAFRLITTRCPFVLFLISKTFSKCTALMLYYVLSINQFCCLPHF